MNDVEGRIHFEGKKFFSRKRVGQVNDNDKVLIATFCYKKA